MVQQQIQHWTSYRGTAHESSHHSPHTRTPVSSYSSPSRYTPTYTPPTRTSHSPTHTPSSRTPHTPTQTPSTRTPNASAVSAMQTTHPEVYSRYTSSSPPPVHFLEDPRLVQVLYACIHVIYTFINVFAVYLLFFASCPR